MTPSFPTRRSSDLEEDVEAEYLKPGPAGDRLRDGALDAYFFVGGYPTGAISELATSSGISLVPISGPEADKLLEDYGFFAKDVVPEGTDRKSTRLNSSH